jgi:LPXTG-site transpeptidase (sortase) family protein
MSDQGRRRPRPSGSRKSPARKAAATRPAPEAAPKPTKTVSARRQRIYRIPVLGTIAYVVWPPRKGRTSVFRKSLSSALAVVALLGVGMAAYPWAGDNYPFFYRVPVEKLIEWSNFLSDLQTNRLQDQLEKEFLACGRQYCRGEGDPLTRIEIPDIGVNTIVVEGTTPSALKAGAGHYRNTPLPGSKGNVAIAGHRTTYGRPFNKVDALEPGNRIILTSPIGRFTYRVIRAPRNSNHSDFKAAWITNPFDWSVAAKTKGDFLTLTTCHPKGSARQRLIVRAQLVSSEPVSRAA